MRRNSDFLRITLAAFLLSLLTGTTHATLIPGAENWNGHEIHWRDFPTGVREATKTKKPVVMVFHATWCTACRKYRNVFHDSRIVKASKDFVMILVDVDRFKDINGAFAPDGTYVPRTIFLDFEGNVQSWLAGRDPKYPHTIDIEKPDELLALMDKAKQRMIKDRVRARS